MLENIVVGMQKLSEAVFCRGANPQAFSSSGCKKSLCLIFALLNFPSTDIQVSGLRRAVPEIQTLKHSLCFGKSVNYFDLI